MSSVTAVGRGVARVGEDPVLRPARNLQAMEKVGAKDALSHRCAT